MNPNHSLHPYHSTYPQHYQYSQQFPAQPDPQHHAQHYAPYHPQQHHPQYPAQYNSHGQQYHPQQWPTQQHTQHHQQYLTRRQSTGSYIQQQPAQYRPQYHTQQQHAPQYPQQNESSPELSLEQRQQALPPYNATHKHHPYIYSTQQEPQHSFTHFDTSTEASSGLLTSTPWAEHKPSLRDASPHADILYPSQPQVEYPAIPPFRSASSAEQKPDVTEETFEDKDRSDQQPLAQIVAVKKEPLHGHLDESVRNPAAQPHSSSSHSLTNPEERALPAQNKNFVWALRGKYPPPTGLLQPKPPTGIPVQIQTKSQRSSGKDHKDVHHQILHPTRSSQPQTPLDSRGPPDQNEHLEKSGGCEKNSQDGILPIKEPSPQPTEKHCSQDQNERVQRSEDQNNQGDNPGELMPPTHVSKPPANQKSFVVVPRVPLPTTTPNRGQSNQASGFPIADYKNAKPKRKKIKHPEGRACYDCGSSESCHWRKGPSGPRTLCNKCGVLWAKKIKKRESGSQSSDGPALDAGNDSRQDVKGKLLPSIKELDLPQMQGVINLFQTEAVQSDYRGSKRDFHGRTLLPSKPTGNPLAQNSHSKSLHGPAPEGVASPTGNQANLTPPHSTPQWNSVPSYKHPQPFATPFSPNRMPKYVASAIRGPPILGAGFSELQDDLFHDIMRKHADYRQESEAKLVNVHKPLLLRHQQGTTPPEIDTVLLGDCLIESFFSTGAKTTLGRMGLAFPEAFNAGVFGDKIGNVLFRLENGMYKLLKGRSVRNWIILAGTKDMAAEEEQGLSAENWTKFRVLIWAVLRMDRGVGSIFVCGVFGRSDLAYEVTKRVNQGICDVVCDFNDWITNREKEYRSIIFVPPPGGINRGNMYDTCRPDAEGYKIWDQVLCREVSSRREIIEKEQGERDRERRMWHARRNVSKTG